MATKLYLRDAAFSGTGTFPTGEQSSSTAAQTWTGANTLRQMTRAAGTAQVSQVMTALTVDPHLNFLRFWCSPPLASSQTVGGGSWTVNVAVESANLNSNFILDGAVAYVWRPSTGAVVGYCIDTTSGLTGALEPTVAAQEQVQAYSFSTSGVSAAAGDVVVFELWINWNNSGATLRSGELYYDGATETATQNTVVSDHASFLNIAETLVFDGEGGGGAGGRLVGGKLTNGILIGGRLTA